MRKVRWASWTLALAMALAVGGVRPVTALVTSDRAAAILDWPTVITFGPIINTVIELSNTSAEPVSALCFYANANSHCAATGDICIPGLFQPEGCFLCVPGWNETDFHVNLTPRQPLGWLASEGVQGFWGFAGPFGTPLPPPVGVGVFALDGAVYVGIGGSSNAGSRIPPVPEDPFIGSLRCIAVDQESGFPVDRNVLKGELTLEVLDLGDQIQVAKHNATGLQAITGAVNDDNVLVLGGPPEEAEYQGCPNYLILNHFFDGAGNPVFGPQPLPPVPNPPVQIVTVLDLVPCCQDYLRQIPGGAVVQYLVYNEFEQRFSTSRPMQCQQISLISNIDTIQNERSIFSAGVGGTLTAQTRINPIGCGLIAEAVEIHVGDGEFSLASFNVHEQGDRPLADRIILP